MAKVINLKHYRDKCKLKKEIENQYKRIEEQINELGDIILGIKKSKKKED